jgi:hypothetical protein
LVRGFFPPGQAGALVFHRKSVLKDLSKVSKNVTLPMTHCLGRLRMFFFLAVLLLFLGNCTRVSQFVESADPYHTHTYKRVCDRWSREARLHRGFEVPLIVSATMKSNDFRRAYAEEYAEAYQLTPEAKKRFVEDEKRAGRLGHEFVMAAFVPETKWDDFHKANSMWNLLLLNDENERVAPVDVRKVKGKDPVMSHFFPYITPWKSVYVVRFPCHLPETNRPIIGDDTKEIRLIITGVLGTAEMVWNLESS